MPFVAAAGLAQGVVRAGHVEDVVNDLEQDTELSSEAAKGNCGSFVRAFQEQYADDRGGNQAPRLQLVQPAQAPRPRLSRIGDVEILATDHPADARGVRELSRAREDIGGVAALIGEKMKKGFGVEPVPGEDGDVLAERSMARGAAPAQVVVVHRREIVVNQRVRVHELERDRQRQDAFGVVPAGERRGERKHRADPLAAGQQRVAHRLFEPRRAGLLAEANRLELAFDAVAQRDRIRGVVRACQRRGECHRASVAGEHRRLTRWR